MLRRCDGAEYGEYFAKLTVLGQGLATEAVGAALRLLFEHTAVASVIGITDARNAASIRLLERLGLRLAATASAVFRDAVCTEHRFVASRPDAGG